MCTGEGKRELAGWNFLRAGDSEIENFRMTRGSSCPPAGRAGHRWTGALPALPPGPPGWLGGPGPTSAIQLSVALPPTPPCLEPGRTCMSPT